MDITPVKLKKNNNKIMHKTSELEKVLIIPVLLYLKCLLSTSFKRQLILRQPCGMHPTAI